MMVDPSEALKEDEDKLNKNFTWSLTSITTDYIELRLDFEDPMAISAGDSSDKLNVHFNKTAFD